MLRCRVELSLLITCAVAAAALRVVTPLPRSATRVRIIRHYAPCYADDACRYACYRRARTLVICRGYGVMTRDADAMATRCAMSLLHDAFRAPFLRYAAPPRATTAIRAAYADMPPYAAPREQREHDGDARRCHIASYALITCRLTIIVMPDTSRHYASIFAMRPPCRMMFIYASMLMRAMPMATRAAC